MGGCMMAEYGKAAAAAHKQMCTNPGFGYTMALGSRWGQTGKGYISGSLGGIKWRIKIGDRDCSSSAIDAWKAVLVNTKYAHALDGALNTSTIERVFVGSGLFVRKPMSFLAEPGDLYLAPGRHVAMCQTQKPDVLSEFRINEKGRAYGGKVGDQTGKESWVRSYYNYPWKMIIHYNGKLDSKESKSKVPAKTTTKKTTKKSIDTIAKEVIAGKWGNGETRKKKLKAAGYDYNAVQKRVNQLLS